MTDGNGTNKKHNPMKLYGLLYIIVFIALAQGHQCFSQTTAVPDVNFEQALIDLGHDSGTPDGEVPTANISSVVSLNVESRSITDMTGIQAFSALVYLWCNNNQLISLDVSQNGALEQFVCYENQLTELILNQNSALNYLECWNNQLSCLNLKNGNYLNFLYLEALNNPALTCIEVDDAAYATTNWTEIDATASFSTGCNNNCALGLLQLTGSAKKLIKVTDIMGRETQVSPNTSLIFIYSDGSIERVFNAEN